MCGRFFLDARAGDIIEHYNAPPPDLFTARYNIAPTTPVLALDQGRFDLYRWGLIPAWAKDLSMGNSMFNARAETVAEKPSFRNAYKRRRAWCQPADFTNGASKTAASNPIAATSITSCFRWRESGSTGRTLRATKFSPARCSPPRRVVQCRNCINACRYTLHRRITQAGWTATRTKPTQADRLLAQTAPTMSITRLAARSAIPATKAPT